MHGIFTHNTSCQPIHIKLPAFAPDEKLAFVERVCGLLIESRFQKPRPYTLMVHLIEEPIPDDHVFFDMTYEGPIPSYLLDVDLDETNRNLIDDLIERRVGIFAHIPIPGSEPISARGSPHFQ